MTHLRRIALTVEESDRGCFTWVLLESTGDAVVYDQEIGRAESAEPAYANALRMGFAALTGVHTTDPLNGPRAVGEDEHADPVTEDFGALRSPCR